MTHDLHKLVNDEKERQRLFPVVRDRFFFAHAAVCPLPAPVAEAISRYVHEITCQGQFTHLYKQAENGLRSLAASLINATPEEIAITNSTSAGLSLVAAGLDWQAGDEVVCAEHDFPANVYPWQELRRRQVKVRLLTLPLDGRITPESLAPLLNDRTRLVALSSAHYAVGTPLDVAAIGGMLQDRGILFCLDAIQTLGAMPCSVEQVDFLVADAHKWLLGPQGTGILFVRREVQDRLRPALVGWKSMREAGCFMQNEMVFAETACRYEPGSLNAIGVVGLHAALELLHSFGITAISHRLRTLRRHLIEGLTERGFDVLGDANVQAATGITSFATVSCDVEALYRQLDYSGIILSLRQALDCRPCLRISPHFYNTIGELDHLLDSLPHVTSQSSHL